MSLALDDPALNASRRPSADQAGCDTAGSSSVSRRTSEPSGVHQVERLGALAIGHESDQPGLAPGRGRSRRLTRGRLGVGRRRRRAPEGRARDDPGRQRHAAQPWSVHRPHAPESGRHPAACQGPARHRVRTVASRAGGRQRPRLRICRSGPVSSVSTQSAPEGVESHDIPDGCLRTSRTLGAERFGGCPRPARLVITAVVQQRRPGRGGRRKLWGRPLMGVRAGGPVPVRG